LQEQREKELPGFAGERAEHGEFLRAALPQSEALLQSDAKRSPDAQAPLSARRRRSGASPKRREPGALPRDAEAFPPLPSIILDHDAEKLQTFWTHIMRYNKGLKSRIRFRSNAFTLL
jgi:hypothetical protein